MSTLEIGQVMLSFERKRNGKSPEWGANSGPQDLGTRTLPMCHNTYNYTRLLKIYIKA